METDLPPVIQDTEINNQINIYAGASMLQISESETVKISASFDENEIEVRPDGLIYLPQVFWRKRLNETFGVGQWCLVPKGSHKDPNQSKDKLYLQGVLLVRGSFVAEAVGEAELHTSNPMQSWASVWESAKSDCITRCCKDLGIASELWQPEFIKNWIAKYAVQVWREKTGKKKDGTPGSFQWRKKTAAKYWDERGENAQSPPAAPQPKQPKKDAIKDGKKRPPISELQYDKAIDRLKKGEDILDKLFSTYDLMDEQKEYLEKAFESSKVTDPKPPGLTDIVIDIVSKLNNLKSLFEYRDTCTHLADNAEFIALIEKRRLEITFPKQTKK